MNTTYLGDLHQRDLNNITQLIASNWPTVAAQFDIQESTVRCNVYPGASADVCCSKMMTMICQRATTIEAFKFGLVCARFGNVAALPCLNNGVQGVVAAPVVPMVQEAPRVSRVSTSLMLIDEVDTAPTMRRVVGINGHPTVSKIVTALSNNDCWRDVLKSEQDSAKVAQSFAHMLSEFEEQRKRDDEFNPAFELLRQLATTDRFGLMTLSTFVETVLAPVPRLAKFCDKLLEEIATADRSKSNKMKKQASSVIGWHSLIQKEDFTLQEGFTVEDVITKLAKLGVIKDKDLLDVDVDDLMGCGFTKVAAKRVHKYFKAQTTTPTSGSDEE